MNVTEKDIENIKEEITRLQEELISKKAKYERQQKELIHMEKSSIPIEGFPDFSERKLPRETYYIFSYEDNYHCLFLKMDFENCGDNVRSVEIKVTLKNEERTFNFENHRQEASNDLD